MSGTITRERNSSSVGWLSYIPITFELLTRKLNGLISLGAGVDFEWAGNLDAQCLKFTTPSAPGTAFEIPHGLERIPVGAIVVKQSGVGQLYDDSDGKSWTDSTAIWKCDQASITFTVLIF